VSISTQGRIEHIGVAFQQQLAVDVYVRHEEKESRVELHPAGLADPVRLEPMRGTKARWLAVCLIAHCGGLVGQASAELAGGVRRPTGGALHLCAIRVAAEELSVDRGGPRVVATAAITGRPDGFVLARVST